MDNLLFYLLVIMTIVLNIWTIINSVFLLPLAPSKRLDHFPKVSVLVPLRNEASQVEGLVQSLKKLTYPNLEVNLLDDQSEDGTYERLQSEIKGDERFHLFKGDPLPDGWNGKVYACHQLSHHSNGTYLLFFDADARMAPSAVEKALATLYKYHAAMISGFPNYPSRNLFASLLVPLQHMVVLLHLPLMVANSTLKPKFTAACGIFILINREVYDLIGGHASVKNSLVEDVDIAREVKKSGYKMILANLTPTVVSFMYDTAKETWEGFKKNIFPGLGRSKIMVTGIILVYSVLFLTPFAYAMTGLALGNWTLLLPFLLTVAFKMFVDARTGHPLWLAWLLPVSIAALLAVMISSMLTHVRGKAYKWKGRSYE
ncbi:glycosyltransferase family 2 protein [Halobacillus salinarum]|uniref:4,4'-diaponeurosporenoate glycosyltransferase n=1 Tax=Halobacillus salinarum TaxID=2932257 RepID=A0ABY4EMA8_9BACI|nr:glycosyltransferase family 2 protein [Halobacillus salinarum]UOQ43241.1 glycosyltransferase family 2 protein [Halobacillus salinarum]